MVPVFAVLGLIQSEQAAGNDKVYTAVPDPNFEKVLLSAGIDTQGTLDGQILTADMAAAISIRAADAGISDLTGIESATSLVELYVSRNSLAALDVTNSSGLSTLDAGNNALDGYLDLTHNTVLTVMNTTGNANLSCIQVADVSSANAAVGIYAAWNKDLWTAYSEDCQSDYPSP